jgi:membrane associated rhomboid family serine protease
MIAKLIVWDATRDDDPHREAFPAAALTVVLSMLPFEWAASLRTTPIVGASGAIYGLLLAYALYFPDRPILMLVF